MTYLPSHSVKAQANREDVPEISLKYIQLTEDQSIIKKVKFLKFS